MEEDEAGSIRFYGDITFPKITLILSTLSGAGSKPNYLAFLKQNVFEESVAAIGKKTLSAAMAILSIIKSINESVL